MLAWLRQCRYRRLLRRFPIDEANWQALLAVEPILSRLPTDQRIKLRELTTLLLATKKITGARDYLVQPYQQLRIAAEAALPVLRLGLAWHRYWKTIIVYEDAFAVPYADRDATGVVHEGVDTQAGQSFPGGPVIVSWPDVVASRVPDGFHVVIHEMAHQLDGLSGSMNGKPPLHPDMTTEAWAAAFNACFHDLWGRDEVGAPTAIDPYATESPAECFAVATEAFFQTPHRLDQAYPDVYAQLRDFYRQDPVQREPTRGEDHHG